VKIKTPTAAAKMMLAVLLSATATGAVVAQDSAAPAAKVAAATPAPKLVVVISVDQFSADLFAEYRGQLHRRPRAAGVGGRLPLGLSGARRDRDLPGPFDDPDGQPPRAYRDRREPLFRPVGGARRQEASTAPRTRASQAAARARTNMRRRWSICSSRRSATWMKARDPKAQVVSVAGKDRAAIMMGGRKADELMWLDADRAHQLSRHHACRRPRSRRARSIAAAINAAAPRAGSFPPTAPRTTSRSRSATRAPSVGTGRLARDAGDFRAFMASPEADGAVLADGRGAAPGAQAGRGDDTTDLLILGLSATDYVGHSTGTEGSEMCLQMAGARPRARRFLHAARCDRDRLCRRADRRPWRPRPARTQPPERLARRASASTRRSIPMRWARRLPRSSACQQPLLYGDGPFGDYYLVEGAEPRRSARRRSPETASDACKRASAGRGGRDARGTCEVHPVSKRAPDTWNLMDKLRASYHPQRSGDFIIALKPRVTPIPESGIGYVATHGSVWDYDRRVPILFWRKGLTAFEQPNAVMTVDIMPTLASVIGLPVDAGKIDGRCLDLIVGYREQLPLKEKKRRTYDEEHWRKFSGRTAAGRLRQHGGRDARSLAGGGARPGADRDRRSLSPRRAKASSSISRRSAEWQAVTGASPTGSCSA
jgi:phosphonoacetate hydrolase